MKDQLLTKAKEERQRKTIAKQAEEGNEERSAIKRKYSEFDVRAANRVALGQVGSVFQPHKQAKSGGGSTERSH